MRLTVLHADKAITGSRPTDVEVAAGTTAGQVRAEVARLTGLVEWASTRSPLRADGTVVDDAHPAGLPPLRPGAVLTVHRDGPERPLRLLLTGDRHIAVTTGPDAGRLLPLAAGDDATIGPDRGDRIHDDRWGATTMRVRVRTRHGARWWRGRGDDRVVLVRAQGSATLASTGRRGRSHAIPRWRWARWRLGGRIHVGASTLELRDSAVPLRSTSADPDLGGRRPASPARARSEGRAGRGGGQLTAMAVSSAGTMVGGVVLAVAVHQPLLALTGLTGPLLWWANRRSGAAGPANDPEEVVGRAPDVAAVRVATALGAPDTDLTVPGAWDESGSLAVVGPRDVALPAARAIALGELGSRGGCHVTVRGRHVRDWAWLVWAPGSSAALPARAPAPAARGLVVADGVDDPGGLARWRGQAPASYRLLWIGPDARTVPAWCRNVLSVAAGGAELAVGDHSPRGVPLVAVRTDVAEEHCRALAGARVAPRAGGSTAEDGLRLSRCPASVALGALPGVPVAEPVAIAAAWADPATGLRAPFGMAPDGRPVAVDLVRDGPHAVVAGTTGAGKSELLTTLVLGLALTYPPRRLAVLLVDFKGGTGLPGLATLPHVVGRLSDLDAARARRVLRGLGAELRRRERIVAAAGVRDVDELPSEQSESDVVTPPRLLVVIDEFRALADDLPELLPGLGRLAAQGRSLGVHLVLATQRPAGAVPAELRANISLRVALRVVDPADSVDLVGVPDAARIDTAAPGRAVLLRGGGAPEAVQVAHAGLAGAHDVVRLAPPAATLLTDEADGSWMPTVRDAGSGPDPVARWVAAARAAAVGSPPVDIPWLPELPDRVSAEELAPGPGIALAMADLPEEQRRGAVRWDPDGGHLLVLGGPRSGRSTTLVTVGRQALAAGLDVHAIGLPPEHAEAVRAGAPHHLGTVVAAEDVVTTARLLDALSHGPGGAGRPLLLVDGLDAVLERLATLARGTATDLLTSLWERSGAPVSLALSAPVSPASARLLGSFADRLVLGVTDPSLDGLAGVPTALGGPRTCAGRAIHLRGAEAALCQVVLPAASTPSEHGSPRSDRRSPVRLCAPPASARRSAVGASRGPGGTLSLPLGVGADDGGVVQADLLDCLLVAGPPGSGRTTALRALAASLEALQVPIVALPDVLDERGDSATRLDALRSDAAELAVLIDDLDEVEQTHPEAIGAVLDRLTAQRQRPAHARRLRVVVATTTAHAAGAYRGLVPLVVRARRALVLDPREPGSADLLGPHARWLADPTGGPVGRGVLRSDRTVTPVQVWTLPGC